MMDANKLPPLPMLSEEWEMARGKTYTAKHMQEYALASIAAAGAPDQPLDGDLRELAEQFNVAALAGLPVTISHNAASRLFVAMTTPPTVSACAPDLRSAITDLSHHLRETADQQPGWKPLLTQAADEIERYYGGMMNWKANAQQKDVQMAEYRAALEAVPVEALTDEEIKQIAGENGYCDLPTVWLAYSGFYLHRFARAIEARIMGGAK